MTNREWFPAYSGEKINPLKIQPGKIHIKDIAHQLSLLTRFGGATERMDSVAQHSVLVSMYLEREGFSRETSLWGLLHDAGEFITGEFKMGIKSLCPNIKKVEMAWLKAIIGKYGLKWPMPKVVKDWDWIVGCNEAFSLVKNGSPEFFGVDPVRKMYTTPWTSEHSEAMFLSRFKILKEETK